MPTGLFVASETRTANVFTNNVMLQRVARFDWASTSAGAIDSWPDELRAVCRTALLSATPMSALIGQEGLVLFNDGVRATFGAEGDAAIGKPILQILPNAASFHNEVLGGVDELVDAAGAG